MRYIIILLLQFTYTQLFAQSNKATYGKIVYEFSKNNITDYFEMYFTNAEYRFRKMKSISDTLNDEEYLQKIKAIEKDVEKNASLSNQDKINIINNNLRNASFYGKQSDHIIFLKSSMNNYCISDSQSHVQVNWNLINSVDTTINNIRCGRAIGNLDKEECIAYYAKDIPVSFAPYQYSGLPGLLIYLESNKKHQMKIHQLEWPLKAENVIINPCIGLKVISREEDIKQIKAKQQKIQDALQRVKNGESVSIDELF